MESVFDAYGVSGDTHAKMGSFLYGRISIIYRGRVYKIMYDSVWDKRVTRILHFRFATWNILWNGSFSTVYDE